METLTKNQNAFLYIIRIKSNEWHYKKGDLLDVILFSKDFKSAMQKFEDKYTGSEFPLYDIVQVEEIFTSDGGKISAEDYKFDNDGLFNSNDELEKL